jgi:hypothetical protein
MCFNTLKAVFPIFFKEEYVRAMSNNVPLSSTSPLHQRHGGDAGLIISECDAVAFQKSVADIMSVEEAFATVESVGSVLGGPLQIDNHFDKMLVAGEP